MSEMSSVPPPPPPPDSAVPPPPPPPPGPPTFDFLKPLTFVFEDPRWVQKVLFGGLFYLAVFLLIGIPFLMGYWARLLRNVIAGVAQPLPEWDDLGDFFSDGMKLAAVAIAYFLPLIIIACVFIIPAAIASDSQNDVFRSIGSGVAGLVWCLLVPLSFLIQFWLPGAMTMVVTKGEISAGFDFAGIWGYIRLNLINYVLAYLVLVVARFGAQIGVILCCIGVIFTGFIAMCASAHAFGQVYRLSPRQP